MDHDDLKNHGCSMSKESPAAMHFSRKYRFDRLAVFSYYVAHRRAEVIGRCFLNRMKENFGNILGN